MPIQVRVRFQDNSDTLITVMNDSNYQPFEWTFTKRPIVFQFDPNNKIILKQASLFLGIPDDFKSNDKVHLSQNSPNPTTGITSVTYEIGETMNVKMEVLNIFGERVIVVCDKKLPAGQYSENIDCSALAAGVYYYRLTAGNALKTKKMVVTR
jgi:hypothetical protein